MMRSWVALGFGVTLSLGACSDRNAREGDETKTGDGGIDGVDDDAGDDGGDEDWKFDIGHGPGPDESYPPCLVGNSCPSGEQSGFANDCGETCLCDIPCETHAECPLPFTGTVTPMCAGTCVLPCGQGVRCPFNMYCYPEHGQCMWGTYNPGECNPDGGDFDQICARYCEMEGACIPECLCQDGMCPCDSDQRRLECMETCPVWVDGHSSQSDSCSSPLQHWLWCITSASCTEVESFFTSLPDGLDYADTCSPEYSEVATWCTDFAPLTEYGF